jgi:hypothetical protein
MAIPSLEMQRYKLGGSKPEAFILCGVSVSILPFDNLSGLLLKPVGPLRLTQFGSSR